MVVPLTDQKRLSHILADDLQPRIDWAYALEQTIALLGGGYLTAGNGDPNGLVTKPEGFLFLDLTTPAVWQNQNGGTVWTNLSAGGGGSGLPDPWTANQTSGEVTATTDGSDVTALTVEAAVGQSLPLLRLTDENGNDVFVVLPNDGSSGAYSFRVTAPGQVDDFVHWYAQAFDVGGPSEYHETEFRLSAAGRIGFDADVNYDPNDPSSNYMTLTLSALAEQTAPLFVVKDENGDERIEGFPNGSINQYLSDPAVVGWLIKMAADQTASPLQIQDVDGHVIYDFDVANGAIVIRPWANPTAAFTSWYAQSFPDYAESDLVMNVNSIRAFELDTYVDNNDATQNYTTMTVKLQPSQTREVIEVFSNDLGKNIFRVLASGAIGTSAGEPADGDINPGECFRWFDPTNGASAVKFKGKSLNGTVVTSSGPMT